MVTDVSSEALVVKYKDGKEKHFQIGTRYGNVTGTMIPHRLTTDLKVGDKVKAGDVLLYNKGFFEPDPLDKRQVLWKAGTMVKVAIAECPQTFEDASIISNDVAKLLATEMTYVRTIIMRFDQKISNLVKVGTEVDLESILCTIEDSITADNDLFSEDNIDTLKMLATATPKAKHKGIVERIEALYHGDVEDMSDTVRVVAEQSDKARKRLAKSLGKEALTGRVTGSMRVEKDPLDLDTIAIKVYITGTLEAGVGDKGVLGNQMKTIFSDVLVGENKTESGEDIGMIFSYLSIANRIVTSPEIIGTMNTLLKVMSKQVADFYFNQ